GPGRSVARWFRENSHGKFTITNAGVLGWYDADKPAKHYWSEHEHRSAKDYANDPWTGGHVEKWAEAIRKAAHEFDFARYDANGDGVLSPDELGILIVIPQNSPFGTNRTPAGRELPDWEPLKVGGVTIPVIAEVYAGKPVNLGTMAHELCHLFFGAPDMYFG